MYKLFFPVVILILTTIETTAQTQFTGWLASFNTFSSKGKTSIHLDVQVRSSDEFKYMQTFLARTGINVKLKNNLIATAGYAYISNRRTVTTVTGYAPEHRIWEQLLVSHPLFHSSLSHRFRLEQRFISTSSVQGNQLENDGNVFANRFRYFIRTVLPFSTQKPFHKGWFSALQNEVFLNIGDKSIVNGKTFDQNRAYIAAGYRLSPAVDLETGYLNQYVTGRSGFMNNHVFQIAVYTKL
jgi:hypothetical protein